MHARGRSLARLLRLPRDMQLRHADGPGLGENMRVAPDQLVADAARHGGEIKAPGLLAQQRVKHHLEQQVAQLIAQAIQITAPDGVGNLVGLLDRKRRNAEKILFPIPRAAGCRVPQRAHERQQRLEFLAGAAQSDSSANTSRRFARMPAVAPQILY